VSGPRNTLDNVNISRANSETDLLIWNLLSLFASFLHLLRQFRTGPAKQANRRQIFPEQIQSSPELESLSPLPHLASVAGDRMDKMRQRGQRQRVDCHFMNKACRILRSYPLLEIPARIALAYQLLSGYTASFGWRSECKSWQDLEMGG
jgi:hypothetical protein